MNHDARCSIIIERMSMAKRLALASAKKYGYYRDEAVAEAYFILSRIILTHNLESIGNLEHFLASAIRREMYHYFKHRYKSLPDNTPCTRIENDAELQEMLSIILRSKTQKKVFQGMMDGKSNEELAIEIGINYKAIQFMKAQIKLRIQQYANISSVS